MNKTKDYSKLGSAYFHGLQIGGLGETALAKPLCFCVDPHTIRKFEKNAQIHHQGRTGVCALPSICPHGCVAQFKNLCKFTHI